MQVEKGDFIICRVGEKKKALLQAKSSAKSESDFPIKALVADELLGSGNSERFDVPYEDMLANLGSNPEEGASSHGVKIQPWREEFTVKGWGPIQVYRSLSNKEREVVKKTLLLTGKRLKKRRLDGFLPLTMFKILPKFGRYAGYYKHSDEIAEIGLHPEDLTQDTSYIIYHESGHGIWFRVVSKKMQARWIKMYHRCVNLQDTNPKAIEKLAKDYLKSGMKVAEFRKEIGEDFDDLFSEMLDWISDNHKIHPKHLDTLMEAGDTAEIKTYMPDRNLLLSTIDEEVITKYAATKPEEFFAEAFAFYVLKKPLPAGVRKLMRITFKKIGAK